MKSRAPSPNRGKAGQAALRVIYWSLFLLLLTLFAALLAALLGKAIIALGAGLIVAWFLFSLFCLYFFRDPEPATPEDPEALICPASGRVDLVAETEEPHFLKGRCRRISIFMSLFDVHIQYAPCRAKVALCRHTAGSFVSALRTDSAEYNERVLIGLESLESPGERIAVRLVAGLIARRIVPWVSVGEETARGQRIGIIQFGSRVDLFFPLDYEPAVREGQKVRGGVTVAARKGGRG